MIATSSPTSTPPTTTQAATAATSTPPATTQAATTATSTPPAPTDPPVPFSFYIMGDGTCLHGHLLVILISAVI